MCYEIECDCPFCPLVKIDLQCCGVSVVLPDTKKDGMFQPSKAVKGDYPLDVKLNLTHIVLYAKNNHALKVGKNFCLEHKDFTLDVRRKTERIFSVCFHNKKKAEAEADCDDPEPVPQSNAPSTD